MRQVVTAVLVARNGGDYLDRTLAALAAQTRAPDVFIAVDASSTDDSAPRIVAAGPAQLVTAPAKSSFGDAVAIGLHGLRPAGNDNSNNQANSQAIGNNAIGNANANANPNAIGNGDNNDNVNSAVSNAYSNSTNHGNGTNHDNEWLWFLAHDSAPEPRALQQLLAAVEIAPSVAIAGPKLMRWDAPDVIAEFGESMTRFGASMPLVEGELDQAQHDVSDDVLGVAAQGLLVRRSLWSKLGGFDPGLPTIDAGLDFSIRARLAGFRVVLVPGARISTAGGPELFGRRTLSRSARTRTARAAQLHRRLVYAPPAALAIHWLSLVPLAVFRTLGHLLMKRPGAIPGEFTAAFQTAFGGGGIAGARRNLHRTRALGWGAIAPLRLPWSEVRERRAQEREDHAVESAPPVEPKVGFISGGGLTVVASATLAGLIAFGHLLGASAVAGGGLLPLDSSIASIWSRLGIGWREIGTGFLGAADPFAAVLAVLASLTFWAPSLSIVLLYFAALPLAAAGAWFAARRLSARGWVPAVAAVLWAVAPPFIGSLTTGHLGAVLAHLLLPWLALAMINAARSWPASAAAALLFAAVAASAPVLAPVLVLAWLGWMVVQPRSLHRLFLIPLPAAALFAPLVWQQLARGNPLGLLADPGLPVGGGTASVWQLALSSAADGWNGWARMLSALGLPADTAPFVVVALLAVPIALALAAPFVPGSRRAVPGLVLALLGFAVAVASSRLEVSVLGSDTVPVWPGSGLSLLWLGLVCCIVVSLDAFGRAAVTAASVAVVTTVILAVPLLGAGLAGVSAVGPAPGRIVPAVVEAESVSNPRVGTLMLIPASSELGDDDRVSAVLQRGVGSTLDDQSTLANTNQTLSETDARLATLAGNLASRSGYDPTEDLNELSIGFVVLADADPQDESQRALHKRVSTALDGSDRVTAVGASSSGLLWRVASAVEPLPAPAAAGSNVSSVVLGVQAVIVFLTLLLAIPTTRRRKRLTASTGPAGAPATTFDEEVHA